MLAWYLVDEPEGHGHSPDAVRANYQALKQHDPHHPVGVTHFLFEGKRIAFCCDNCPKTFQADPAKFKDKLK